MPLTKKRSRGRTYGFIRNNPHKIRRPNPIKFLVEKVNSTCLWNLNVINGVTCDQATVAGKCFCEEHDKQWKLNAIRSK